jgi:Domain of unknown function (DUF4177)
MKERTVILVLAGLSLVFLAWSRKTIASEGTAASVTRYEYCQSYRQYFEDTALNRFGSQGWELVSFNTIGEKPVNSDFVGAKEYVLTFKRPVGSGLKTCAESQRGR